MLCPNDKTSEHRSRFHRGDSRQECPQGLLPATPSSRPSCNSGPKRFRSSAGDSSTAPKRSRSVMTNGYSTDSERNRPPARRGGPQALQRWPLHPAARPDCAGVDRRVGRALQPDRRSADPIGHRQWPPAMIHAHCLQRYQHISDDVLVMAAADARRPYPSSIPNK